MPLDLSTLAPFAADAAPTAPAGSGPFSFVLMTFVFLVAMYFIIVLPRRSQEKQAKRLLDALKVNDKVMTTSGMIGTVHSIDREGGEVVLKVDDSNNVKIRFAISAIYFVFNKEAAKDAAKSKDKNAKK